MAGRQAQVCDGDLAALTTIRWRMSWLTSSWSAKV